MSIYDKASLVLIPSGTKTSKVYSQKPVSGDGDFTFSRSTAATRVNASGNIEKETSNLLLQSNTFDTTWVKVNTTLTSGQAGYDGTTDAWLVDKSAASARIEQYVSASGVQTLSAYAKAGSLNWTRLNVDTDWAYYDLANGVVGTATGSNIIDHSIEDAGGGWYRCVLVVNRSITTARIYPADADNNSGGTSGNIYIQDAQLEQGLVARDYIETTTAAIYGGITDNVPRLDYTDSSCPALLLEPQRTNAVSQSEYLNAIWGKTSVSVTSNAAVSPEGVQNAAKLVEANASSFHFLSFGVTINAEPTTFSFYAKAAERTSVSAFLSQSGNVGAIFDLSAETATASGTGNTASIESVGNDWYRCVVTNDGSADLNNSVRIGIQNGALNSYQGDGTSGVYIWGAQLEINASYPTSYIPTYGSAVTRNQCFANKTGVSSLIGQSEGTLFLDFKLPKTATPQNHTWVALKDSPQNNRILVYFLANSETLRAQIKASGTSNNFSLGTISNGDRVKIAIAYKSGNSAIYINGSSSATSTNTLSFGTMDIIDFTDSSAPFEGDANQMLVFPTRLTNAELADLTTL